MSYKRNNQTTYILYLTILLLLVFEAILNLTPSISRDALVHHLAIPKLWLQNGGFYEMTWAEYSYYPMYIDLFYVVCLYFKNDIAPKFIHLLFGFGIGVLVYHYIRQRINHNWGLLGLLIFTSTPIVIWLSTSAYIDLGMTFFTTASILCLIRWFDDEYIPFRWLFLSAVCMGIAVGSKYNALIAFMVANLLLIFLYARGTKEQLASLKYGFFYAIIVILAASPWYLKNYFLTGNPFYPLFDGFFQSTIANVTGCGLPDKKVTIGMFQFRELLYGEKLWETLLIPIRMFFQGNDHGYRYFQGVLNPILIIFTPFVFIQNTYRRDKFIFFIFTIIFILLAYFNTRQQVRYLLPVFPFLTILAVIGSKNLIRWLSQNRCISNIQKNKIVYTLFHNAIYIGIIILLSFNGIYLANRVKTIKPFSYIWGSESKESFLRRNLSYFPAVEFINSTLPEDAVILTFLLGRQGYYLNRAYKNAPSYGMDILSCIVKESESEQKFKRYVKMLGATHILWKRDLVQKYLSDNFDQKTIQRFLSIIQKNWLLLYQDEHYSVFDLQDRQTIKRYSYEH